MRLLIIFHILIFVVAFASSCAYAQQSIPIVPGQNWCVPPSLPKVNVQTDTDRINWVFSKSEKELDRHQIDTVNPYGNNVITDVGGLMQGGIKMSETMQFSTLSNPQTGQICMFYDHIDIGFHIFPTIYIASDNLPGTCMHNAIKEHELKHIATDREIVNKYAQLVGQAVQAEIQRQNIYGPVPISNQVAIQSQMKLQMESALRTYSAAMDAERRQRQQAIDNLQEYERVNHLCDRR